MADEYIIIKSPKVFEHIFFECYHELLNKITMEVITLIQDQSIIPTLTSAWRDDEGVHGAFRGIDFRTWAMTRSQIDDICQTINERWQYDPERPQKLVLIYHDVGRGPHLHLQVHPNTVLKEV